MQISEINNINFGHSLAYESIKKDPREFYAMETNQKLNALYDMFQTAGKERRVLADNQAKIMQKMRQGFSALCLSDYYVRKAEIEEAFKHANINFLD